MTTVRKTAPTLDAEHHRYSFGQFILDVDRGALLKDDSDIPLRPKCFEVLKYLVEHHGVLIMKDQLMTAVWPNLVVTEDSLTQCLIKIRQALGDKKKAMVRTIPRRGFLFDVPVTVHQPDKVPESITAQHYLLEDRMPSRWSMAVAVVLAMAISATWLNSEKQAVEAITHGGAVLPASIAILAFEDMSPNQDQAYFADGISEEVLNLLAQTPELHVIARTSSFAFKGQNLGIASIAKRLNVANVLEGSVRKEGNKIRITAQLVDASNSGHLWSQTYDRTLDNILDVQSDIAASVATVLRNKILGEQYANEFLISDSTANEHYVRAKFYYDRRALGDVLLAAGHFQKAVDIDPGFADAWIGLSGAIRIQIFEKNIPEIQGWARMKSALDKALVLDPNNPELHIRLYNYYSGINDRDKSRSHFERALQLGQNSPLVLSVAAGVAMREGDMDEAIDYQRRAASLDSLGFVNHENLAHMLYFDGQYEEARMESNYASTLSFDNASHLNRLIGLSWVLQGQYDKAWQVFKEAPGSDWKNQGAAMIHHIRGEFDQAGTAVESLQAVGSIDSLVYLAEVYAFRNEFDESFLWLGVAIDQLLEDPPHEFNRQLSYSYEFNLMLHSPFLKLLQDDSRWSTWINNTESRIMLARSDVNWETTAYEPNPRKMQQSPDLPD